MKSVADRKIPTGEFIDLARIADRLIDAQTLAANCEIRGTIELLMTAERLYATWALGGTANPRIPNEEDDARYADLAASTAEFVVRALAEKCGCHLAGAPEVLVSGGK